MNPSPALTDTNGPSGGSQPAARRAISSRNSASGTAPSRSINATSNGSTGERESPKASSRSAIDACSWRWSASYACSSPPNSNPPRSGQHCGVQGILAPARDRPVEAQPAGMTGPRVDCHERPRRRVGLAEPVRPPTRHLTIGTQPAHVRAPHTHRRERPARKSHIRRWRLHSLQQLLNTTPTLHRTIGPQSARPAPRRADRREPPFGRVQLTIDIHQPPTIRPSGYPQTAPMSQPATDRHEHPLRLRQRPTLQPPAHHLAVRTQTTGFEGMRRCHQTRQRAGHIHRLGQFLGVRRHRRGLGQIALLGSSIGRLRGGLPTAACGSRDNSHDETRHPSMSPRAR